MSNAEKNSGLNLSGLGLKTAMITATLCSTPSRTKTTYCLILCKKALNFFLKKMKNDKIFKSEKNDHFTNRM